MIALLLSTALFIPLHVQGPPVSGGPVIAQPAAAAPSVVESAPHTTEGLRAWLAAIPRPWGAIGRCESLGDGSWRRASRSHARGVFQFLPSTWRSLGLTGDPADYSWRFQLRQAERLAERDGLRHSWVCAR
jgi:hypothetical protein